jgi:hypothetical protein
MCCGIKAQGPGICRMMYALCCKLCIMVSPVVCLWGTPWVRMPGWELELASASRSQLPAGECVCLYVVACAVVVLMSPCPACCSAGAGLVCQSC